MIYATKGNEVWYLNSGGTNVRGETLSKGSDSEGDYFTINSSQVRATAVSSKGYDQGKINMDHGEIDLNTGGKGHMMEAGGWRDVEMTGYFYVTSSADDDFVLYCRGGTHTDGRACEGFAYKAAINYLNGQCRVRKEQWHSSGYVSADWRPAFGKSIRNRWVGFKAIFVNRGAAPNISVYMECWIDKENNNNWERIYTFTDSGQSSFGGDGDKCGGKRNQVGTWSGPFATFRWDTTGVRFKKFSVREIKEDGDFTEPPPPGGGGPTPPPIGEDPYHRFVYPSTAVKATSADGNVPANVNDGSLDTRWSSQSLPATLTVDLGAVKKLGYVRVAWYRGTERTYTYEVATSLDNSDFSTVKTGSSFSQADFERYDFTDLNARYVSLTVLSNSQASVAAVSEFDAWGDETPIGQEPPAGPEPPGPDPAFVYLKRKHTYNVNYTSEDLCSGG